MLQFFFPRDYLLWPHLDQRIDFETALERSCNKYTVELATLALTAPRDLRVRTLTTPLNEVFARQTGVDWTPPADDTIEIAGQPVDFPIGLGVFMNDDGKPIPPGVNTTAAIQPGTLNRIDEAPFIESFEEITGVRTYGGLAAPDVPTNPKTVSARGTMVTMQYDLRPWRGLVEKFTEGEDAEKAWKLRAAFQAVSPERVNLSFNQVTDFRTEFVSVLLGGASSTWTNVQLAEALSRLVTKRRVEASMLHALRDRERRDMSELEPSRFTELAVSDEARNAVLRGMSRVIRPPHGTADDFGLAQWLEQLRAEHPAYNVALFSKTGSPTVTRREATPTGEILTELVRRGHLFYTSGRIEAMRVPYAAPGTSGRTAFLAALERATRAAARRASQPYSTRSFRRVTAYVDRFMRYRGRSSDEVSLPFQLVNGVLVLNREHPAFDPARETDSAAVYILSLVKWKGAGDVPTPEELQQPDARVVTAVFFVDLGPGSPVAVEAARAMLPRIAELLD